MQQTLLWVRACVCVCVSEKKGVKNLCVCVWERERERERERGVREREREREGERETDREGVKIPLCVCVCECVCVYVYECVSVCVKWCGREGEGETEEGGGGGGRVQMLEFDGQKFTDRLSCDHIEPLLYPTTWPPPYPPLPSPSLRRRMVVGVRFRERSGDTVLSNSDQKRKKRAPAHRGSLNSPDSGKPFEFSRQWWRRRTAFSGEGGVVGDFPKKAESKK